MSNKHKSNKTEEGGIPVVSMDYMFMQESSGRPVEYVGMPSIVMAGKHMGCMLAELVPETTERYVLP